MGVYRKALVGIFCVALLSTGVAAGDMVTITGTVNNDGQLVDDAGQVYEIADNDLGWQVMDQSGEEIEVEGELEEDESGIKVIVVKSFKLFS